MELDNDSKMLTVHTDFTASSVFSGLFNGNDVCDALAGFDLGGYDGLAADIQSGFMGAELHLPCTPPPTQQLPRWVLDDIVLNVKRLVSRHVSLDLVSKQLILFETVNPQHLMTECLYYGLIDRFVSAYQRITAYLLFGKPVHANKLSRARHCGCYSKQFFFG